VVIANLVLMGVTMAETVDFSGFAPDDTVDVISTPAGNVVVFGTDPRGDSGTNYARVFDSSNPTCGDTDLGTPNAAFGGPGLPENLATNNDTALGNVLIIQDAFSNCSPDDVDRTNLAGVTISFDFAQIGPISIDTISFVDIDGNGPDPRVELYDALDNTIGVFVIPQTIGNGVATVDVSTPGVDSMTVFLQGSGAMTGFEFDGPPNAALGDRVWEDLDVNGIQDCEDTNQNSIIGDAGDTGPECGAGIPDVPVNLLSGDCATPLGQMVMTDLDGFYLFQDLDPGAYCVEFGKPPADFCDTDGFDLGEPQFTMQNVDNDDAVDSDADTVTGVTDPVSLAAGQTDLTVDAGIYCPAKIGDRVWTDDNKDGLQDPGEEGVPGVTVKLFECTDGQPIVDNDRLVRTTTTDDAVDDMNYMFGAEPDFALHPGEYFVQFMNPDGTEFTVPNVNGDVSNSDCLPPDGISSCVTLGSRGINLNRDCGLIPPPPPECDLELDKSCRVETPPVSGDLECEAKIAATVLEYTGGGTPGEVIVEGKNNKAQVISSFDDATGILTVDARPEDLGSKMTITTDGVAEVIHTSCSTPYVAGLPAPLDNPKGDPSANWLVLSFVDKNGGSASVPGDDDDGLFTDDCTFTPGPAPSCATLKANDEKLSSLSFAYTGGGCPGDNDQGDKSSCSGSVDPSEGVTVQAGEKVDNLNYPVDPMFVAPDGEFTIDPDKFKSNSALVAGNMGGTEINEFHTSCSQPLAVGDVFGSFTLVAINGQSGSTEVTYQYIVTNNGDPLSGVLVTDDPLGAVGGPIDMITDQTETFFKSARITETTVNIGTAVGLLSDGSECPAADSTTVTVVEPPVVGGECDGKVTDLVLKNLGADAQVRVEQKKDEVTVFDDFVPAEGEFSFSGTDKKGTLSTEISIFVDGILNTKIHTSCSKPIGPGLVSGSFEVISGNSRNGGPLPPL